MVNQNSNYDKRQVELMSKQLDFYQQGNMDLGTLISRLEGLFSVLENQDVAWAASFWEEWDALESVFADAVDEENTRKESCYQEIVDRAVNRLIKIFSEIL